MIRYAILGLLAYIAYLLLKAFFRFKVSERSNTVHENTPPGYDPKNVVDAEFEEISETEPQKQPETDDKK